MNTVIIARSSAKSRPGSRVRGKARNKILAKATAAPLRARVSKKTRKETANTLCREGDAYRRKRPRVAFSRILEMALNQILVPGIGSPGGDRRMSRVSATRVVDFSQRSNEECGSA